MDEGLELTRAELAERLGVSVGALRKWEAEFSQWIQTPPGVKGYGQPRYFSQHDAIVFATIAKARREGKKIADIHTELDDRLAEVQRDAALGESPLDVALGEAEQPARVQLALYFETAKALESAEGELRVTREERDYLRTQLEELRAALIDAERRAARAEGERDLLAGRPPTFWQRLFGSGKSD